MKHLRQFCRLLVVTFLAETLQILIPAPIPASVYGMALLFVALKTRVIDIDEIEGTGVIMLARMPLTLVPAAVGLIESTSTLRRVWAPGVLLILFGTLITVAAAGGAAQLVVRWQERNRK